MILGWAEAPSGLAPRYDVCVAGGGVAGIVLALALGKLGRRVVLMEGGGLAPAALSQDLYRGLSVGHDYPPLDACRLRYLGGTSNHWAGWCRPLDAVDFDRRAHIPGSGWPIGHDALEPYLAAACEILEIPAFTPDRPLPGSQGRLVEIDRHRSAPVRFGEKYRADLQRSDRIHAVLDATLVHIGLDPHGERVSHLGFAGPEAGDVHRHIVADKYVLALGGLENARILLNAGDGDGRQPGNAAGLLGRSFMDHPHADVGYYVPASSADGLGSSERFLALTPAATKSSGTGGACFMLKPLYETDHPPGIRGMGSRIKNALCASEVVEDFLRVTGAAECATQIGAGRIRAGAEQLPNPASRVRLSAERDRYGLRRLELDWQLQAADFATLRSGALAVAAYFARADIGRVKLLDWVLDAETDPVPAASLTGPLAASHHMGTTRMGSTDRDGVVDRNGRVFGVENLYVAGSGVFRTSGYANPTLSIVQLALRLADHLASG